jgi:putative membrane protein
MKHLNWLWLFILTIVFIWSAINPKDLITWWLEVLPVIIGIIIMGLTYNRFRLTSLLYFLIFLHCIILLIGGHYTYAEVPMFEGLFGYERNNYDKVGHFFQGFVPAIIAREILIRKHVVNARCWLNVIIVSICLAFSAFYELIEWWVAAASGDNAVAFLGTQGYQWDTQSDMALARLGAIVALLSLAKLHDKQLKRFL